LQLTTQHIVLLSGGLASFEMAKRVLIKYGEDQIGIWFFDTLIEDEDLYRFIDDAENWLGRIIIILFLNLSQNTSSYI